MQLVEKEFDKVFINKKPFYFRDGTSDSLIVTHNLLAEPSEREYKFEQGSPRVIVDIGANIGAISVLMSILYPDAIIYAFEPSKENYDLLLMNIAEYRNIIAFNIALGDCDEKRKIFQSTDSLNHGGKSFHPNYCNTTTGEEVDVKNINKTLEKLGITQIDLIKIDCEGSEAEILMGLDYERLSNVGMIVGELHSIRDFELLDHLSSLFSLEFSKRFSEVNYQFRAIKRLLVEKP